MRKKEPSIVISFHKTVHAIEFEKKAKEDTFPGRLIPIPREITAGCGMAWMIRKTDMAEAFPQEFPEKLEALGIPYDQVYELTI